MSLSDFAFCAVGPMLAPGGGSQVDSDTSGGPSLSKSDVPTPGVSSRRAGGRRRVGLWVAVVLATALTLAATLSIAPIASHSVSSGETAFLELRPPANGTIPGRGILPISSGLFCQGPPTPPSSANATGTANLSIEWYTVNGTKLSHFEIYVPSYMGIVPGTDVYAVANASEGNFSQQVEGPGALCHWAMDFEATFATFDAVELLVHATITYSVAAPLL